MKYKILFFFVSINSLISQNIDVNNDFNNNLIRNSILTGKFKSDFSLNIRTLDQNYFSELLPNQNKIVFQNKSKSIKIKTLGLDYFIEFNSNHPYNRNNGTMIPNRGYQHLISTGLYLELGPLSIQFKPEHHFSENKLFEGFWQGHYPEIWSKRYRLWNHIDMPERFGNKSHNKTTLGQSFIRINLKSISIGISNENLWWGPSLRNSIMMSNHAQSFKHLSFNTRKPIKTFMGNFEWQFITGYLNSSGFNPPGTDIEYAGRKLYIEKINQLFETDDKRFLQAFILNYSPKFIKGLSMGIIRWSQMYSALIEGRYAWISGNRSYFPVFDKLFRSNNSNVDYEMQTNEAGGFYFKWFWPNSNAEIYSEIHFNDSRFNFRDLILNSDHSKAMTLGFQKYFKINQDDFIFNWEWTQMEQTASRLLRNASSWYEHYQVYDGYTNRGEVLGSGIGPGSNSHYFSLNKINGRNMIGIGLEIVENDNDFYHESFASANDFRRYWKDINLHLKYNKSFKHFNLSSNLVYIRSLNYQWELDDYAIPYYHSGRDLDNFHLSLKLTYFGNW